MVEDEARLAARARDVRTAYDRFDLLRLRGSAEFDAGDVQNIHTWMRTVAQAFDELADQIERTSPAEQERAQ